MLSITLYNHSSFFFFIMLKHEQECCMSKHRGWGQEAHTAQGEAECCMVTRDPTLSALLLIQHILSMLYN